MARPDREDRQDERMREFARLLCRSYAHLREVREQRAIILKVIAVGDQEAVEREWQGLAGLILEHRMISQYLRTVFDTR